MRILWLKRDLRMHDHAALHAALEAGPVLGLFVFEPSLWRAPDADRRHLDFLVASLEELRTEWRRRGGRLLVRTGELPEVLDRLLDELDAVGVGSPDAVEVNVAVSPGSCVAFVGSSVTTGAATTSTVAAFVVALPEALVKTARYCC